MKCQSPKHETQVKEGTEWEIALRPFKNSAGIAEKKALPLIISDFFDWFHVKH